MKIELNRRRLNLMSFYVFPFSSADGLSSPSGNCSAGWYCTGRSYMTMPTFSDTASANISSCSCPLTNYTGGRCWPGTFCPEGSPYPVDCTPGQYCSITGLIVPEGPCNAG